MSDKSQRTPTPPGLLGGHPACENPLKSHLGRVPPLSKPPPRLRYPGGNGQLCWKAPAQGPPGAGPAGPQVVPPRREGRPDTKHRPPGPPGPQSGANSTPGRVSHAAVPGGGSGARRGEERRGPGRRRLLLPPQLQCRGAAGQDPPPSILRPRGLAALPAGAGGGGRCPKPGSPGLSGAPAPQRPGGFSGFLSPRSRPSVGGCRRIRRFPACPLAAATAGAKGRPINPGESREKIMAT